MKNGIKTTEFWLSIIGIIGLILSAVYGLLPADLMAKYSVYIVAAYTVARAIAKITPSTTDDKVLDAIDEKIMKYFKSEDSKKN
jgi:hypothetical protein